MKLYIYCKLIQTMAVCFEAKINKIVCFNWEKIFYLELKAKYYLIKIKTKQLYKM